MKQAVRTFVEGITQMFAAKAARGQVLATHASTAASYLSSCGRWTSVSTIRPAS